MKIPLHKIKIRKHLELRLAVADAYSNYLRVLRKGMPGQNGWGFSCNIADVRDVEIHGRQASWEVYYSIGFNPDWTCPETGLLKGKLSIPYWLYHGWLDGKYKKIAMTQVQLIPIKE